MYAAAVELRSFTIVLKKRLRVKESTSIARHQTFKTHNNQSKLFVIIITIIFVVVVVVVVALNVSRFRANVETCVLQFSFVFILNYFFVFGALRAQRPLHIIRLTHILNFIYSRF